MSGRVFLVQDRSGRNVLAKHLTDSDGNYIVNPRTGAPYIAPFSYTVEQSIEYGRKKRAADEGTVDAYLGFHQDFKATGPQDIQRSYNGVSNGLGPEFVEDFRDVASFHFGLSMRASGLSGDRAIQGGGIYNGLKDLFGQDLDSTGDWWNNPRNPPNIRMGSSIFESGRVKIDPEMVPDAFPFDQFSVTDFAIEGEDAQNPDIDKITERIIAAFRGGKSVKEIEEH